MMASSSVSPPPTNATSSSSAAPITNVSYEAFAPRSTAQVSRLSRIAALTAGPPSLSEVSSVGYDDDRQQDTLLNAMSPPLPPDTLSSSFINDYAFDETVTKTLEVALQRSIQVTTSLKHCTSLRLALRASINIAEDISNRHADLIRHSGELSAAADRLQGEQEMLTRHAQEIGMPLKHYDAVDSIGVLVGVLFKGKAIVRGLPKVKVDNDDFPALLDQIDDSVDFFGRESGGRAALEAELKRRQEQKDVAGPQEMSGNIEYYRRSLALQEAALDLIREAVVERISTTTNQIVNALQLPKVPIAADKLEASLVYTRFHGISSRSNRLLSLVRKRLHRGDAYYELLQLCRSTYCRCRENLLKATVRAHMDKLKEQHGLVGMTRLASVFLIRLCTVETALYLDFFGDKKVSETETKTTEVAEGKARNTSKGATPLAAQVISEDGTYYDKEFQAYLSSLSSALHRTIRRGLVTLLDLDTLCQVVSVLREERSMASSSPTTTAAARAISSVIADAQERLIFCATTSLNKEVIRFKPTPNDLDYPNKLTAKTPESSTSEGQSATAVEGDALQQQLQIYESWFPPMRSVLKILSKIFRVVEPRVFEDIALQSVQSCTRSLKDAAVYIQKRSGTIHSDLFLVKHLLILREQLSPFDMDLRSVERQLDFSDAGKAVSRFLANRNRRLFSMSTENALVTLLREGVSMKEESVDSKRDLEEALRSACNEFIDHSCHSIAGGVMELASKLNAATGNIGEEPFFHAAKVKEMLSKASEKMDDNVGNVTKPMGLYLDNPSTQSILLKPIAKKIFKALEELRKSTCSVADGNNGWDGAIRSEVLLLIDDLDNGAKKAVKSSSR